MKPKILYISHETGLNGASKSLLNIIEAFQDKYDIYVLLRGEGKFKEELKKYKCRVLTNKYYLDCEERNTSKGEIVWLIKKLRYAFYRRIVNLITAKKIARFAKNEGITLIHSNSSSTFMGAYISSASHIPHVWHFREFLWEDFRMCPMLGWNYFYKLVAATTTKVICVSDSVLNKYQGLIKTDMVRIYNGVPGTCCEFKQKTGNTFNILQAGIVSKVKGVDVSIDALGILLSQGFDNIHLYLAGKGTLDFSKAYNERDDIKEHVHLMGYVDNLRSIREDKIDVELICSRAEAFGRVTVEAMQSGLVVIGANTAGTAELIVDGNNGFLFKSGSAEDLANKIKWVYENRENLDQIRNNALTTAKSFSIQNCTRRIDELYGNLLCKEVKKRDLATTGGENDVY